MLPGMEEFFNESGQGGQERKTMEVVMNDTIKITATTVTPLLQIDENGGQRRMYIYEGGQRGAVPFFSANGFRGALRRMATRQLLAAMGEKAKEIGPEAFYLLTSGASLGKISVDDAVTPENENLIRERFPVLSLFGAGLTGIEGKSAVAALFPASDTERIAYTKEGKPYSPLLGNDTYFRSDAIREEGLWRSLIDVESIMRWTQEYLKKVAESKAKKKSGEAKSEEHSNIQQPVSLDFILPGVKLTSSINAKYGWEFSDVELGCLISALKELSTVQIGSAKRIGFGLLNWTVETGGAVLFRTECDPDYVLERHTSVTEEGERLIGAWREWLKENAKQTDFSVFEA